MVILVNGNTKVGRQGFARSQDLLHAERVNAFRNSGLNAIASDTLSDAAQRIVKAVKG